MQVRSATAAGRFISRAMLRATLLWAMLLGVCDAAPDVAGAFYANVFDKLPSASVEDEAGSDLVRAGNLRAGRVERT